MGKDRVSRRSFLRGTAVTSTGAALAALPATLAATAAAPVSPPWPVTVESYPLDQPGPEPTRARIKLVISGDSFPDAYLEKLRSYAPNLEVKACENTADFRREIT